MSIFIRVSPCARHTVLPLLLQAPPVAGADISRISQANPLQVSPGQPCRGHVWDQAPLPYWPVGTTLHRAESAPPHTGRPIVGNPLFRVVGRVHMPHSPHAQICPLLESLTDIAEEALIPLHSQRQGRALAWITLSDKGHLGQREDLSGPAIESLLREHIPLCHAQGFMLPDNADSLKALLVELALGQGYDLICTTGGTGLGPRDVSPEATLPLLEKRLHGFEQAMMQASLAKTPHAAISRAVAGVLGQCIIINLPGSRKAVVENLAAVIPPLGHAMDKLHGDPADCGG